MKRWIALLVVLTLVGMFPVSVRIADPLFSTPYDPRFPRAVLLIFPERVEIWRGQKLSEISPRPKGALYTFAVPPSRQAWVEQQVQKAPAPRPGSTWNLKIRQLGSGRQRIELEAEQDGLAGLIYDASSNEIEIVPVASRLTGPGGSLLFASIDVCLSFALWMLFWLTWRLISRGKPSRA